MSKAIAKMISVWEERRVFGSGKVIQVRADTELDAAEVVWAV